MYQANNNQEKNDQYCAANTLWNKFSGKQALL